MNMLQRFILPGLLLLACLAVARPLIAAPATNTASHAAVELSTDGGEPEHISLSGGIAKLWRGTGIAGFFRKEAPPSDDGHAAQKGLLPFGLGQLVMILPRWGIPSSPSTTCYLTRPMAGCRS